MTKGKITVETKFTSELERLLKKEGIIFLTYCGLLTSDLINGMTGALEDAATDSDLSMGASNSLFTIFVELSQNMMNYSKVVAASDDAFDLRSIIMVGTNKNNEYYVSSQNIMTVDVKEKIEPRLIDVTSNDKETIKKMYRELRRSGKGKHSKGAGLGFYEMAKRCNKIEYEFQPTSENKVYFKFVATISM